MTRPPPAPQPAVRFNRRRILWIAAFLVLETVALVLLAVFLLSNRAQAADLGAVGPVYPIAEPDMLQEIEDKLRAKERSGEIAALQEAARRRIEARIQTPPAVQGLRRAQVARSWHFDPSVRFDEPVVDDRGRIVVAAGTTANPLQVVSLKQALLFFDGRDVAQVEQAKGLIQTSAMPVTPILVGGSPLALSTAWKRQVFFDQGGALVRRFGIGSVPARVTQDGMHLLVQELPPSPAAIPANRAAAAEPSLSAPSQP